MTTQELADAIKTFVDYDPKGSSVVKGKEWGSSKFQVDMHINKTPCDDSDEYVCLEVENRKQYEDAIKIALPDLATPVNDVDQTFKDEAISPSDKFYLRLYRSKQ